MIVDTINLKVVLTYLIHSKLPSLPYIVLLQSDKKSSQIKPSSENVLSQINGPHFLEALHSQWDSQSLP